MGSVGWEAEHSKNKRSNQLPREGTFACAWPHDVQTGCVETSLSEAIARHVSRSIRNDAKVYLRGGLLTQAPPDFTKSSSIPSHTLPNPKPTRDVTAKEMCKQKAREAPKQQLFQGPDRVENSLASASAALAGRGFAHFCDGHGYCNMPSLCSLKDYL